MAIYHHWTNRCGEGYIVDSVRDVPADAEVGMGPLWVVKPDTERTDGIPALEILRLASPEAAWETVEAFHRGARLLGAERFRGLCGFPTLAEHREAWSDWQDNPWYVCENFDDDHKLFAECLRLGREAK